MCILNVSYSYALNVSLFIDHSTDSSQYDNRKEPFTINTHTSVIGLAPNRPYVPTLHLGQPICFGKRLARAEWLLISRKNDYHGRGQARDLTEWVGRAGPTGDDTVVSSRKNTR